MANPKFLGVDISIPTYSWSEGVNSNYPLSNLKTYYPDQKSRSNGTTDNQTFNIDFGTAVSANTLIIDGCNFDSLGSGVTVTLQYFDGTWQAIPLSLTTPANNSSIRILTGFNFTKQLWRLLFTRGSALAAAPEIGNIFLGTSLDFEKTQEWGFYSDIPDFEGSIVRSLDGRTDTSELYGISKHEIEFKLITDSFVTKWRTFLRTVKGTGRPFYYIDNNSAVWLVNFEKSFNPAKAYRYNQNDILRFTLISTMGE